jgi:ribose/xylose/arabinose/galactoside ABC-type transport system permease subunit
VRRAAGHALRWEVGLTLLGLVLFAYMSLASSNFFTSFTLQSLALNATVIGFLALGVAPVIVSGEIDISVAAMLGLCTIVLAEVWQAGVNIWLAALVSIALGCVLGLLNGIFVVLLELPSLAITLGSMGAYTGIAFLILGGSAITGFPSSLITLGSGLAANAVPWSTLVLLAVAAVLAFLLHRTTFGRVVFAVGSNKQASRYSGLAVVRTKLLVFVISGCMAGVAAIFYAGYFDTAQGGLGSEDLLPAITVVILGGVSAYGGTGTLLGVVLALFVLGVLQTGLGVLGFSGQEQTIAVGLTLILALAVSAASRVVRARFATAAARAPA